MTGLGPHAAYILAAYAGVALVTFALIGLTIADARRQKGRLEALEAAGVRRRSDKRGAGA